MWKCSKCGAVIPKDCTCKNRNEMKVGIKIEAELRRVEIEKSKLILEEIE